MSEWAGRSAAWAAADDEHFGDHPAEDDEEDPYAAMADLPSAHKVQRGRDQWLPPLYPQELPPPEDRRVEIPSHRWVESLGTSAIPPTHDAGERSRATAWWIAIGVIIVGLAVAAGVLVGLRLAARAGHGPSGAAGATGGGHAALRITAERVAAGIGAGPSGGCEPVTT
ncbi:hypothetical protein [Dactylosporangium sp. NPDC051484]|uniref:hypothetical protein n=1 Tax=Dactylosporangium sp. NPDC051484 TaxID=3154942 RepID=UPI00344FB276